MLFVFMFIYDPSKAWIVLTLCDLMEFSRENWVSYSGLAAINTGVAVKRGLRQHFSAYRGAGESVHRNIVTGSPEHNFVLDN